MTIDGKVEYESTVPKPKEEVIEYNKRTNNYIKKKIIKNNGLKINNFGQRYKSYTEATKEQSETKKEKPKHKSKENNSPKKINNNKLKDDYKVGNKTA